jgi:hypothetical protein
MGGDGRDEDDAGRAWERLATHCQTGARMTPDADAMPMPSADEVARQFVEWLEARGATFRFRRGNDWQLDLNGVPDVTQDEARELSEAAFDIRDEIRAVLMLRRASETIH